MKAIAILTFMLGVMSLLHFTPSETVDEQLSHAIALNYAVFRNAVYVHVFSGNKEPGDISRSSLDLPEAWKALRQWQARIDDERLYVWGPASSEEIERTRDLFWGSLAVGRADGGRLEPGHGGTTPVPSFVPDGNLVSVVGVN